MLVHADYRDLASVLGRCGVEQIAGAVADLGVSSMQVDDPARGFSFKQAGPLDMRMDRSRGETLADRLHAVDERTLADVIFRFGEERHSRRVARAIVAARDAGRLADDRRPRRALSAARPAAANGSASIRPRARFKPSASG